MSRKSTSKTVTVIGHDPAQVNYGVTALKVKVEKGKASYRILQSKMLQNTLKDLKENVRDQLFNYVQEVKDVLGNDSVSLVGIERFMNRGGFTGAQNEVVNQMIGALYFLYSSDGKDVHQFSSAIWKAECNRHFQLDKPRKGFDEVSADSLYKLAQKSKVPNHLVDSSLQALFLAQRELGVKIISKFAKLSAREKLVENIRNAMPS